MNANRAVPSFVAAAYAATAAIVLAVLVGSRVLDRAAGDFTRDPVTVLEGTWYVGFLSHVGTVVWSVAATCCLLAAILLAGESRWAFAWAGLLTAALLADDVFLLHETFGEKTGASERFVLLLYPVATVAYLVRYRRFVRRHDAVVLGVALVFFAVSAVVDARDAEEYLLEDALKLFGIVSWALFFALAAVRELRTDT
jgi:hypothetical protein